MKVTASVRNVYRAQKEVNKLVKTRVDELINRSIKETWHFESRLKGEQSFALKLETGRFAPEALEDFYACTIVVPNLAMTREAEDIVSRLFDVVSRKPENDEIAMSEATNFSFDHTRLYVHLKRPLSGEESDVHNVLFEIQIKTFLQHAWSVATHDLTYKTTNVSWGKERVAAQVKAALEAAEVSILEAEMLATQNHSVLHRKDAKTSELLTVIAALEDSFDSEDLPEDMKRLAQSIHDLIVSCDISIGDLYGILREGALERKGHPHNLSPFSIIVQYLFDIRPDAIGRALNGDRKNKILIPSEIEIPSDIDRGDMRMALFVECGSV
ncbi:nucleotidyltransferase family protein [Rhodococcus qingshengii]|uniref:hypothetical protein n=1 Tax=Rhodococcus qingshengii TaxID=334542 RepID=UPI0021BB88EC|nr:hypothetical protein [Rhodococcus qingshengii]UXF70032.1 hypothetical protein N6G92_13725 [Rhodococcus qingshengii]